MRLVACTGNCHTALRSGETGDDFRPSTGRYRLHPVGQTRSRRHRYRRGGRHRRQLSQRPHQGGNRPGGQERAAGGEARRRHRPQQDIHQLCLDPGLRLPRHVHAGRLCPGGDRPLPGQERQPYHGDEHDDLLHRPPRLLGLRLRHPDGWRGEPAHPRRRTGPEQ